MYYTVIKHSGHLRTLKKCRKHLPAALVFYISLVFSNASCVLSQCNTHLRLLYLLNNTYFCYMITSPFTLSQYTQAKEWRLNNDIDHILDHDVSILVTQCLVDPVELISKKLFFRFIILVKHSDMVADYQKDKYTWIGPWIFSQSPVLFFKYKLS